MHWKRLHAAPTFAGLSCLIVSTVNVRSAQGQCTPVWTEGFVVSGANNFVLTTCVFDSGKGPALFAGGNFTGIDGVEARGIARWDGSTWHPMGTGVSGGGSLSPVNAMTVFDDGSGPALYIGGFFTMVDGVPANNIARWDGRTWSALGPGVGSTVYSMVSYDDGWGDGPVLYVCGLFNTFDGDSADYIARWNGKAWSALPGTASLWTPSRLAVFDDGTGEALYMTGSFTTVGSVTVNHIARWDGTSWSALGDGLSVSPSPPSATRASGIAVFDDGTGPALFVSGSFVIAGDVVANHIAKWDGRSWSSLGTGLGPFQNAVGGALTVFDDGTGPNLYVTGVFTTAGGVNARSIARWNGTTWSALESGVQNSAGNLLATDNLPGWGPSLIVSGLFNAAGAIQTNNIARWNGQTFSAIGSTPMAGGMSNQVDGLATMDLGFGDGPSLYSANNGSVQAGYPRPSALSRWDGQIWKIIGGNLTGSANALARFDDHAGNGQCLYVSGSLFSINGVSTPSRLVKQTSATTWQPVNLTSPFATSFIGSLATFNDQSGGGAELYLGGTFTKAGVSGNIGVIKWNGVNWSLVGASGWPTGANSIRVLQDPDTSGPALFVASNNGVYRWNGISWAMIGVSNNFVHALTNYDDGTGIALCAGGRFVTMNGVAANGVAKWKAGAWTSFGGGIAGTFQPRTQAMAVGPIGDGQSALYVGGFFQSMDGQPAGSMARWDGTQWNVMDGGVNSVVNALAVHDDGLGGGPALFVGGSFGFAGGILSNNVARWGCDAPVPLCPGDTSPGNGTVDIDDLVAVITSWGACANPSRCPADVFPPGGNDVVDIDDLVEVITHWGPCP